MRGHREGEFPRHGKGVSSFFEGFCFTLGACLGFAVVFAVIELIKIGFQ